MIDSFISFSFILVLKWRSVSGQWQGESSDVPVLLVAKDGGPPAVSRLLSQERSEAIDIHFLY